VKPATSVARAARNHETARATLEAAVKDARACGVPVQELARLACVTRPTIYSWINRKD
jgi:transposase-like protein